MLAVMPALCLCAYTACHTPVWHDVEVLLALEPSSKMMHEGNWDGHLLPASSDQHQVGCSWCSAGKEVSRHLGAESASPTICYMWATVHCIPDDELAGRGECSTGRYPSSEPGCSCRAQATQPACEMRASSTLRQAHHNQLDISYPGICLGLLSRIQICVRHKQKSRC